MSGAAWGNLHGHRTPRSRPHPPATRHPKKPVILPGRSRSRPGHCPRTVPGAHTARGFAVPKTLVVIPCASWTNAVDPTWIFSNRGGARSGDNGASVVSERIVEGEAVERRRCLVEHTTSDLTSTSVCLGCCSGFPGADRTVGPELSAWHSRAAERRSPSKRVWRCPPRRGTRRPAWGGK
jgi:hypothetical protein